MTIDSFELLLHAFSHRVPFRPYWIEFTSGDRVEIRHPEIISRTGNFFYFRAPDRELRVFEAEVVVQFIAPPSPQQ